ncbi:PAS domain S-box protein [Pedobacter sp. P351]|uniref:PAS domain S-box protein n=1 Tax=Pedobacter superstes TaxID=3133441 RepID=UPI0030AAE32B
MNNSEQVLELLFEEGPQPMWIYRLADLKILNVNRSATEMYGYTKKEFQELTLRDLRPDSEREVPEQILSQIDLEKKNSIDVHHKDKYGNVFWVQIVSIPYSFKGIQCRLVTTRNIQEVLDYKAEIVKKARDLQRVLDNSLDVICSFDIEGRFIQCSRASEDIWGYSPDELIGELYMDFIVEEDREFTRHVASQIMAGTDFTNFQNRYRRQDGSTVYIVWSATWDAEEETMFCIARDATEKVNAEKLLKGHSDRTESILESITDGFFTVDRDWNVTYWNYEAERILRRSRREMLGKNLWNEYKDAMPLKFYSEYQRAIEEQISVQFEEFLPRLDLWFEVTAYPSPDGLSVYFKDVTSKHVALQELSISEARHRGIVNSQTNYLIRTDLEAKYTYFNGSFFRDFGWMYSDGELIGKDSMLSILPYHHKIVIETVKKCLSVPNEVFQVEIDKPRKDGGVRSTLWDFLCVTNADGTPKEIQCSGIDISDRIAAEAALKESVARYDYVMKATTDAIWDWDLQSDFIYWGESFTNMFGHQILNNRTSIVFWGELVHPEDFKRVNGSLSNAVSGELNRWEEEYRFKRSNGDYVYVRDRGFVVRDEKGNAIRMVGSMADITERKLGEIKLKELNAQLNSFMSELISTNQELEQFSYIVSHNLRAPVANLMSLARLLKENSVTADEMADLITGILSSSERLDEVIADLNLILRIKGKINENKISLNILDVISSVKQDLADQIQTSNAKIQVDLKDNNEVLGIRSYIFSIFYNLLSNSIKYSRPNISPVINISSHKIENKSVLVFSDNGLGIDLANQAKHLFGLYKRFHYHTEGRGMGLYIVKTQVQALGGKIDVNSTVGQGTIFTIELPVQ